MSLCDATSRKLSRANPLVLFGASISSSDQLLFSVMYLKFTTYFAVGRKLIAEADEGVVRGHCS
jgi:hypothetical protein